MRIRFLSTYEPPNTLFRDLLPHLAGLGHDVEVLISRDEYRRIRGPLREAVASAGVDVVHLPSIPLGPRRVRSLLADLTFAAAAMLRTLFGRRVDVNVFVSHPPLFAIWGSVLRLVRRQPYLCVTMDVYPDVAVAGGVLPAGGLVTRLLGWLATHGWRRSDGVVAIGRCMAARIRAHGIAADRVHVIANWAPEVEAVDARTVAAARRRYGGDATLLVMYSGNMGVAHSFEEALAAAAALRHRSDIAFAFVGDGSRRQQVAAAADALPNVALFPYEASEQVASMLTGADVHLVTLRPGFEGTVVPSKAYAPLALGRPIIFVGGAGSELALLLDEIGVGSVVSSGDGPALLAAVERYAADPGRAAAEGEVAAAAMAGWREQALAAYADLLTAVGERRH